MFRVSEHPRFTCRACISFNTSADCAVSHLEPGGYLEESELSPICYCDDDSGREDSLVKYLSHDLRAELETHMKRDYNHAERMKSMIE